MRIYLLGCVTACPYQRDESSCMVLRELEARRQGVGRVSFLQQLPDAEVERLFQLHCLCARTIMRDHVGAAARDPAPRPVSW